MNMNIHTFQLPEIKRDESAAPKFELDGFGSFMFGLSPKILYSRKRMDFLIETYDCRDTMFRGYGGFHLRLTDFTAFSSFSSLFGVVPILPQVA